MKRNADLYFLKFFRILVVSDDDIILSLNELNLDHLVSRLSSLDSQSRVDWYSLSNYTYYHHM